MDINPNRTLLNGIRVRNPTKCRRGGQTSALTRRVMPQAETAEQLRTSPPEDFGVRPLF